jgi:hypothetical protein
MGRMSDLHIEKQESGMLDDYPPCLTTETLANEILFHFQGRGPNGMTHAQFVTFGDGDFEVVRGAIRPDDQDQNALELRNLIQELLDRHMTVFYQP